MNKLIQMNLIVVILITLSSAADPTSHWYTDLDEAMKVAQKEDKIVMLAFRDPEHYTFDTMNTQVFATKEWKEFEEKEIVPVYLQVSNSRNNNDEKLMNNYRISQRHGVNYPPEYHFLSADGKEKIYKTSLNIWREGTNKIPEAENEIDRQVDRHNEKVQGQLRHSLFTKAVKSIILQTSSIYFKLSSKLSKLPAREFDLALRQLSAIDDTLSTIAKKHKEASGTSMNEYMTLYRKLEGYNYWNTRSKRDENYIATYLADLSKYATKAQIDDLAASIDRFHDLKDEQDKLDEHKKSEQKRLTLRKIELENRIINIYDNRKSYRY